MRRASCSSSVPGLQAEAAPPHPSPTESAAVAVVGFTQSQLSEAVAADLSSLQTQQKVRDVSVSQFRHQVKDPGPR